MTLLLCVRAKGEAITGAQQHRSSSLRAGHSWGITIPGRHRRGGDCTAQRGTAAGLQGSNSASPFVQACSRVTGGSLLHSHQVLSGGQCAAAHRPAVGGSKSVVCASRISRGSMFVIGLTGSIGMGKSTVSTMFQDAGVPIMDSDAVVHELYAVGGAAVPVIQQLFPDAIVEGGVDRKELSKYVIGKDEAMKQLEDAVHPLVEQRRLDFLKQSMQDGHRLVVLDVPLLFETKMESKVDSVVVVSAGAEAQRERVLARPGMTEEKFLAILGRQVPDAEKCQRAQHVIDTGTSMEETQKAITSLISELSSKEGEVAKHI